MCYETEQLASKQGSFMHTQFSSPIDYLGRNHLHTAADLGGGIHRYSKPETFAVLKQHRDKKIEEQSAALNDAQKALQETLEQEVRGTGTRIQVKRLVTSLYSMYKRARAELAARLTGIPLEEVPDSQVLL
jgi:hypothetical protein